VQIANTKGRKRGCLYTQPAGAQLPSQMRDDSDANGFAAKTEMFD